MQLSHSNQNQEQIIHFLNEEQKIIFSGNFDSGNLQTVEQLSSFTYRIIPRFDKAQMTTKKTYFHFNVYGFHECTVKFIVSRAYLLEQFIKNKQWMECYHPVFKILPNGEFNKLKTQLSIYYNEKKEPELSFTYAFTSQKGVQFAFSYPYSYQNCQHFIEQLSHNFHNHPKIYFHQETLCITASNKQVSLLTITARSNCQTQRQNPLDFMQGERPLKIDRPKVVVSARVHPGQSPSSFCMQGLLLFLLNPQDERSELLRQNFHFIIIPMINVEGVSNGLFRCSPQGYNLNRVYQQAQPLIHEPIYTLTRYINSLEKVNFFFDLHSHPSLKGFFIYGNAMKQAEEQTEAQLFGKLMQTNCPYFENLQCIFSEKAMNSKDRYDEYTKQGCARVFYHRTFNIIHSYTVECGYFKPKKLNHYPQAKRPFKLINKYSSEWQNISLEEYTPDSYKLMGKALLITLLDLFHLNPFTRFSSTNRIQQLRQNLFLKVINQVDRFKDRQSNISKRLKELTNFINNKYYQERFSPYELSIIPKEPLKPIIFKTDVVTNSMIKLKTAAEETSSLLKRKSIPIRDHCPSSTILMSLEKFEQETEENSSKIYHQQLLQSFSKYDHYEPPILKKKSVSETQKKIKTEQSQPSFRIGSKSTYQKKTYVQELQKGNKICLKNFELQAVQRWIQNKIKHDIRQKKSSKSKQLPHRPESTKNIALGIKQVRFRTREAISMPKLNNRVK